MEKLDKLGKKLKGEALIIGFPDGSSFVRTFQNNNAITKLYILNNTNTGLFGRNRRTKKLIGARQKRISITRLAKEFKKEPFDFVITDFETIRPFFRSFIKNSVKVAKQTVYVYQDNDDYNPDEIRKRYARFGYKVEETKEKNRTLFEISTEGVKYPLIKGFLYHIRDIGYDLAEFIANVLIG